MGVKRSSCEGRNLGEEEKNDNGIRDALLYYFVASSHLLLESHPPKTSSSMGNDAIVHPIASEVHGAEHNAT